MDVSYVHSIMKAEQSCSSAKCPAPKGGGLLFVRQIRWFSKWGPQITWHLIEKPVLRPHPETTGSDSWGHG